MNQKKRHIITICAIHIKNLNVLNQIHNVLFCVKLNEYSFLSTVTTSKPVPQSVAFFAVMTDHQQHLGIHQTVGFQKTVTNVGNGWDEQANIFKAPKAGLYYFSATIMSHYAEDIDTELVLKGIPIVHSYDGDTATHGVGTLSAVLNLALGDDVWIRIFDNPVTNTGNVRVYGDRWSWFSGFLISE